MILRHFLLTEVNEANVYLAAGRATRQAALVDAGGFDPRVVEAAAAEGLHVRWILVTHDHYDHTGGLDAYLRAFPESAVAGGAARLGGHTSRHLADGESFEVGDLRVQVFSIPGHTAESLVFHWSRREEAAGAKVPTSVMQRVSVLFSGDALFAGSVGGTAGEAAHQAEIAAIRRRVFTLPDDTLICPGHGPMTTVGVERAYNPFF